MGSIIFIVVLVISFKFVRFVQKWGNREVHFGWGTPPEPEKKPVKFCPSCGCPQRPPNIKKPLVFGDI